MGEVAETQSTIKDEIFEKKAVTTTLNALHQRNWPHLWKNDTWTMASQLIATYKASRRSWWDKLPGGPDGTSFREVLMGQASKRFSTKSTGGRMGWRGEGVYKEVVTMKNRACNLRRKKKRRTQCIQISLS